MPRTTVTVRAATVVSVSVAGPARVAPRQREPLR